MATEPTIPKGTGSPYTVPSTSSTSSSALIFFELACSSACLFLPSLPPLEPIFFLPASPASSWLSASSEAEALSFFLLPPLKAAAVFLNLAMRWVTALGVHSTNQKSRLAGNWVLIRDERVTYPGP